MDCFRHIQRAVRSSVATVGLLVAMGGFVSAATATTLFLEDFEDDPAGNTGNLNPVIRTASGNVGGSWSIIEADSALVQVRNDGVWANPSGGNNSLRIDRTTAGAGLAWAWGWTPGDTAGQLLQLDFDIYVPTNGSQRSYLTTSNTGTVFNNQGPQVRFLGNGQIFYVDGGEQNTGLTGILDGWQRVTVEFDMVNSTFDLTVGGSTATALPFEGTATEIGGFGWASNNTPNSFLVDNVQFQIVPEPASLALVGLGGLLMLRRRRRA